MFCRFCRDSTVSDYAHGSFSAWEVAGAQFVQRRLNELPVRPLEENRRNERS